MPIEDIWSGNVNTRTGGKKIYFEFSLHMKPYFSGWNYVAKDRFQDHFQRNHASNTYDGNIDYDLRATSWRGNTMYGEGTFVLPESYIPDFKLVSDLKDVAYDAVGETKKYELSNQEQDLIKNYTVTITSR